MKRYIKLLVLLIIVSSCSVDDSEEIYPDNNPDFSLIAINSELDTLSVDFGDTFIFEPEVSQLVDSKNLTYRWTALVENATDGVDSNIVIGEEKKLDYTFVSYGNYDLRLEVKNEDYSAFYTWKLKVRVYDEGIMIAGEDENGNSSIAFARKLLESEISEGKQLEFKSGIIETVNPEYDIKDIVYIKKSVLGYPSPDAFILLFCSDVIYVVDAITFKIIALRYVDEFSQGDRIKDVSMTDSFNYQPILFMESGNVFEFSLKEWVFSVYSSDFFENWFANLLHSKSSIDFLCVDNNTSKLWFKILYGPSSFGNNTSASEDPWEDNARENDFEGRDFVSVGKMNGYYYSGTNTNNFAIATDKANPQNVKFVEFNIAYGTGYNMITSYEYVSESPITLSPNTELVANAKFYSMYYFEGGDIYLWYPLNLPPNNQLPTSSSIQLDGNKVVTCMSISYDMTELYVGIYDPDATGSYKGGLYIYDCEKIGSVGLQPKQKFEGITHRPVNVYYKGAQWSRYSH